jgi:hypothetical protein
MWGTIGEVMTLLVMVAAIVHNWRAYRDAAAAPGIPYKAATDRDAWRWSARTPPGVVVQQFADISLVTLTTRRSSAQWFALLGGAALIVVALGLLLWLPFAGRFLAGPLLVTVLSAVLGFVLLELGANVTAVTLTSNEVTVTLRYAV